MFNSQPDTNAASSFFNSAASVHSTDGFNLSDRGSTTGSAAPTPKPVIPANPSPVVPAAVAPQVSTPVSAPPASQVNQAASLHGQQQAYSPYQQYQAPQQQQQQQQPPAQQQNQQQQQQQYYQQYPGYAQTAGN